VDPNRTAANPNGPQVPGVFTCFSCSISTLSSYTLSGSYAGNSSTRITITFTAATANPVLAWGGHIATELDWGSGNSAVDVNGSPYHTRLITLDGSGGNQDRSLSAAAVAGPPTISTQVSSATVGPGGTVTDTATFTGSQGTPTGTATFFICGP